MPSVLQESLEQAKKCIHSSEVDDVTAVCKRYTQANCKNAKPIIGRTLGLASVEVLYSKVLIMI